MLFHSKVGGLWLAALTLFTGIVAHVPAADVCVDVAWDPSPDADISEYTVYYGQTGAPLTNIVKAGLATTARVCGLSIGFTYSFHATATSSSGVESLPSELMTYFCDPALTNAPAFSNGSFETEFKSWTASGNLRIGSDVPNESTEGRRAVKFNSGQATPNGVLSQSFATAAGRSYQLAFDAGVLAYNRDSQRLEVTVRGANSLLSQTISMYGIGNGTVVWTPQSFSFVADGETATLTFRDVSPTSANLDLLLDNVRVVGAAASEPQYVLSIRSFNPNSELSVSVSPADYSGAATGATGFDRSYNKGAIVSITAPATTLCSQFRKWVKNGVDFSTNQTASVTMDSDQTLTAIYSSSVLNAYVFYNNSDWDKNDPTASASDDQAIAPDKGPLRPGERARYVHYTGYSLGINGVMIDISALPGTLTPSDFSFKVGNDNNPASWAAAPTPTTIAVRKLAGINGSDRVTLVWPDQAIRKQWLEVSVLPTDNTGLAVPYVFYFGNAVGETGDTIADAKVNVADVLLARANQRTLVNPAALNFPFDFNRDRRVNAADELIARGNQTTVANALRLIDLTGGPVATLTSASPSTSARAGLQYEEQENEPNLLAAAPVQIVATEIDASGIRLQFQGASLQPSTRVRWTPELNLAWQDLPATWTIFRSPGVCEIRMPIEADAGQGFFLFESGDADEAGSRN